MFAEYVVHLVVGHDAIVDFIESHLKRDMSAMDNQPSLPHVLCFTGQLSMLFTTSRHGYSEDPLFMNPMDTEGEFAESLRMQSGARFDSSQA